MEVRIEFSADIIIEGKDLDEIASKWENMRLFSQEAIESGVAFCETLLAEDTETHEDFTSKF